MLQLCTLLGTVGLSTMPQYTVSTLEKHPVISRPELYFKSGSETRRTCLMSQRIADTGAALTGQQAPHLPAGGRSGTASSGSLAGPALGLLPAQMGEASFKLHTRAATYRGGEGGEEKEKKGRRRRRRRGRSVARSRQLRGLIPCAKHVTHI